MSQTAEVTILFTDLVGSTAMLDRLGPGVGDELLRRHFAMLRESISQCNGREVKNLGDGLMVAFKSAPAGAACAASMQRSIARHNNENPQLSLGLRVGVNRGSAIVDAGDYFGMPVVIAKRLCDRADGGQIFLSGAVREVLGDPVPGLRDLGSLSLKGVSDPVPAAELDWQLGWDGEGGSADVFEMLPDPLGGAGVEAPVPFPATLAMVASRKIVGRLPELARLDDQVVAAGRGERRLVLLAGEPGIGKTRLAAEVGQRVFQGGGIVLYGRCDDGGVIPFQPFTEALGHYVNHAAVADLQDRPEEHLGALAKLIPEIRTRLPWVADRSLGDAETERYRLFEAIVDLLASMASREPVVLVLDDLHWADRATLLVLKHLMRTTATSALLVVGTYRDVEVGRGHPLATLMDDLRRERHPLERFELAGLSREDVDRLVAAWAGQQPPPNLTEAVWVETEGHPYFVEELLRHLLETGAIHENKGRLTTKFSAAKLGIPESIRSVIQSRLARLDSETQRILTIGAVIGREFTAELVERVSELSADAIFEHLEEAASARLVVETRESQIGYRFSHALVQECLYDQLSRSRRANLHLLVGSAMESGAQTQSDRTLGGLAHHFFEATSASETLDKAISYSVKAAEVATGQFAYEGAADHLQRALDGLAIRGAGTAQQCELMLDLGENLWNAGDFGPSRKVFVQAADIAEQLHSAQDLALAALGMGGRMGLPHAHGTMDTELVERLQHALQMLEISDSPIRARTTGRLASALMFAARADAETLGREAIAMARRIGDEALLASILSETWMACWRVGNLNERLERSVELKELATRGPSRTVLLEAQLWRTVTLAEAGRLDEAGTELDHASLVVDELHQLFYSWLFTVMDGGRAVARGDLETGEQLMWQAVDIGQICDYPGTVQLFAPQVLHLRLLQGRLAEIHGGSKSMVEYFQSLLAFRAGLMEIYTELNLVDEARREFERLALNNFSEIPDDAFWITSIAFCVGACTLLQDRKRAELLYKMLLPHASHYIVVGTFCAPDSSVERLLGMLATVLGRQEVALDHLERGLELELRLRTVPGLARTRVALAEALLLDDSEENRSRAHALLTDVVASCDRHGLMGIKRRAMTLQARLDGTQTQVAAPGRRSFSEVSEALRSSARAAISTRGRAGMGRLVGSATDGELEQRFGSQLALRAVFTSMAKGFQPSMAFGFEGEIQFEILPTETGHDRSGLNWWTIQIEGNKAAARHRTARNAALTLHLEAPDFIRLVAGNINPIYLWLDKRIQVEGDLTLANRLVELFGGDAPLAISPEFR